MWDTAPPRMPISPPGGRLSGFLTNLVIRGDSEFLWLSQFGGAAGFAVLFVWLALSGSVLEEFLVAGLAIGFAQFSLGRIRRKMLLVNVSHHPEAQCHTNSGNKQHQQDRGLK